MRPSETYRQRCLQIEEQFWGIRRGAFDGDVWTTDRFRDVWTTGAGNVLPTWEREPIQEWAEIWGDPRMISGEQIEIYLRSRWCEVARRWWGMQRFLEASASHASIQVCPTPHSSPNTRLGVA